MRYPSGGSIPLVRLNPYALLSLLAWVVLLFLVAFVTRADAKPRTSGLHPMCNITMPCQLPIAATPSRREHARRDRGQRGERHAKQRRAAVKVAAKPEPKTPPTIAGYIQKTVAEPARGGVSLDGVVPALAAKAREIQEACGSKVISSVRRTRIRGTRTMSLHASGQAVDMSGNPECMYERLSGWSGGYSVDYARMRHIHISYSDGGREWGARFSHGGRRYARRGSRYASAGQ